MGKNTTSGLFGELQIKKKKHRYHLLRESSRMHQVQKKKKSAELLNYQFGTKFSKNRLSGKL